MTAPRAAIALALCALAGCAEAEVRPAIPRRPAYASPQLARGALARVVVAPATGPAADPETSAVLEAAVSETLARAFGLEVLAARSLGADVRRDAELLARGVVPSDALVTIEGRGAVDAVLFVRVMRADPYPPQRLSVRVDLLSTRTGALLYAHQVSLDAAEEDTLDLLEDAMGERGLADESPLGRDLVLLSRERFSAFACEELFRPLFAE